MSDMDKKERDEVDLLQAIEKGIAKDVKRLVEEVGVELDAPFVLPDPATVKTPLIDENGLQLAVPPPVTYISPANWATFNARVPTLQYLITKGGAKVDGASSDGRRPLHIATSKGNAAIIQWLVEIAHADVNACNFADETPAYHSLYFSHMNVFNYLLEHGARTDVLTTHGFSMLHMAASKGHAEALATLVQRHPELVEKKGPSNVTPVQLAALGGHLECVKVLVEQGKADIAAKDLTGNTALTYAVLKATPKHSRVCAYLVEHDALSHDDKASGPQLLHAACTTGDGGLVRLLLARGVDPDAKNDKGQSPLHTAAFNGRREAVVALVEGGANVNAEDEDGETASFYADLDGHDAIVKYLKDHGATYE